VGHGVATAEGTARSEAYARRRAGWLRRSPEDRADPLPATPLGSDRRAAWWGTRAWVAPPSGRGATRRVSAQARPRTTCPWSARSA